MSRPKKIVRNKTCPMIPPPRDPVSVHRLTRSSTMNRINDATKLNTRLIDSIPGGDLANMKRLMTMGANPNATCRLNHMSACHIAAMHDNGALDLLLRSGADGSRSDKQGRTPLHLAAWSGNAKQIASLLMYAEVARHLSLEREARGQRERSSVEDHVGISLDVVHVVVKRHSVPENNLEIIRSQPNEESALSDCWCDGLEHNCRNLMEQLPPFQQGWTELHAASARAQHHCVEMLLTVGADVSAQDQLCRTPLDVAGWAHYMGHKINVDNLIKTVDLLLKAGGKFLKYCSERHSLVTPLHTAVELKSEAAVEQMLQGGASAKFWNSQGLTAMHVCVKKRNKELLQLLANHKYSNEDPYLASVDVKDVSGSTVLCAAVKSEWIQGVCIALGAGASIILKANEETPIHIAAQLGNIDILQKILNIAKNSTIDFRNEKGETALFKAISNNHFDVLKFLLRHGSSIEVENSQKTNVFHVATKYGRKEILEYLLKYDSNITKRLINKSDWFGPPLYYAIEKNHPDCAELLISKGAQVNARCKEMLCKHELLYIAAYMDRCEIAKMIIKEDSRTIDASSYYLKWTPLHVACYFGNRQMIELLLHHRADLSAIRNENNYNVESPIELLMKRLSKPTEFMQEIFDSYITNKGQDTFGEVEVDYRVLFPKRGMKHMSVIKALINTGNRYDQNKLLLHPLVQSFLYFKWRSISSFFYGTLALHVCFVLSLNVFALSLFWYKDRKIEPVPSIFRSSVWIYIIYFTSCLLTIQEIIVSNMKSKSYLLCLETSVKWLSTTLAVILPQVVSWDSKENPEWVRLFSTATLLFTWVRMMFLLSRLPRYGYYFLMYGKVATKVFKILVSVGFLIFGFAISFMIQFHAQPPFEGPWSSLLTTMVMMTSELGYNEIINQKRVEQASASLNMIRVTFVLFLIFVSIILMNLLVGVAVNDVNSLEIIGSIKRLEKQVQFIISIEETGYNLFPSLYKRWFENTQWENTITLVPSRLQTSSNGYRLPACLKEAIFENAQSQRKQSNDERGTMLYQMKLDAIYNATVKKCGIEPPRSEGPDNALMMKLDEIHKVIVKKDGTEPPKSESPDNALMMKLDEMHKVIVKKDGSEPPRLEGPENALMMKLDEMHKVIVKNDSAELTTTERLTAIDTAMHKLFEEIFKLRNELEMKTY